MNKQTITFTASEQTLTKTGGIEHYASNIVSYIEASFTLGDNWTGYDSIRAVWESGYARIATVLDANNKCIVPAEVLTYKSKVNVNLVGSIVENTVLTDRLTTYPILALTVDADARVDSSETTPVTASQFEQFVDVVRDEASAIQNYTYDSEAWAVGQRAGVDVPSTDETYHNNAKYYADQGATLQQEVTDLKSDINDDENVLSKLSVIKHRIEYTSGGYIAVGYEAGTVIGLTPIVDSNYEYAIVNCSQGDKFEISAKGMAGTRAWTFLDGENKLISKAVSGIVNTAIIAPANAVKLILNNKKSDYSSESYTVKGSDGFKRAEKELEELITYDVADLNPQNGYYDYDSNSKTFYANASYRSVDVSCESGDFFKISDTVLSAGVIYGAFWDSNNAKVSVLVADATTLTDVVVIAPPNCTSFTLTGIGTTPTVKIPVPKSDAQFAIVDQELEKLTVKTIPFRKVLATEQAGYYDYGSNTKNFYSASSYKSIEIACQEGDIFSVDAYLLNSSVETFGAFWDSNGEKVLPITNDDGVQNILDKRIVAPEGSASMTLTGYAYGFNSDAVTVKKGIENGEFIPKPLYGYKYIAFGDSITATANRWRGQFIRDTGAEEIACYAVGGATLVDWEETILDGNISDGAQNTVCNQVAQFLLEPPEDVPDFVIISAGTNDSWSSAELSATSNTQFVDNNHNWIALDNVDRKLPDGAMRWQAEKIWSVYPNTTIIFGAPIQCAESIHAYDLQLAKNNRMKLAAQQLSCNIILGALESGIYGRYETANVNGKYLADGLHPNSSGGILLGHLYAKKVISFVKFNAE